MIRIAVLAAAALALPGCAPDVGDDASRPRPVLPAATPSATPTAAPLDGSAEGGSARGLPALPRVPGGGRAAPERLARDFGRLWASWSPTSVAEQQRRLATMATGGLRRFLRAEARDAPEVLREGDVRLGSAGRVQAVDVTSASAERARAIVVLREELYVDGRRDSSSRTFRVYAVAMRRTARGWLVERWEAQR
jgi:hypothetical protein